MPLTAAYQRSLSCSLPVGVKGCSHADLDKLLKRLELVATFQ